MTPSRTLELEIAALNAKGNGIGTAYIGDSIERQVEVPCTVPGDYVRVSIRRKKHKKWYGTLLEVLRPGSGRREPRCRHFGTCGGCSLQQLSYAMQLQHKENYVRHNFEQLIAGGTLLHPIVPSPDEWRYRNKMEYTFSSDASNSHFLGLIMRDTKRHVLNLEECHLVSTWFTEALTCTRTWWQSTSLEAYRPSKNTGTLRTLVLREGKSSKDRMVMLTVSGNPEAAPSKLQLDAFVASLRSTVEPRNGGRLSIFLRIHQALPGVTTNFYEMLLHGPSHITEELTIRPRANSPSVSLSFQFSPTAFFQPHPQQSSTLYSLALQLADLREDDVVYDLYCGIGTISICASCIARKVIGIEISPETALDARLNAKRNKADHVIIHAGAVRHVLAKLHEEKQFTPPSVVFVDPPRAGLDPFALQTLLELAPSRLIYISCNPATQARDVGLLVEGGYQLMALQPVDQFPQIAHVENIAFLVKGTGRQNFALKT